MTHGTIGAAPGGETMTPEQEVDNLLREFQRACESAAAFDPPSPEAAKLRAILRNDLRARLLSPSSTTATPDAREILRFRADQLRAMYDDKYTPISRDEVRLIECAVRGVADGPEITRDDDYVREVQRVSELLTDFDDASHRDRFVTVSAHLEDLLKRVALPSSTLCPSWKNADGSVVGGCGKPIAADECYRCLDCGVAMHKDCLRSHCGADEKDALIGRLQRTLDVRNQQLDELAALPSSRALSSEERWCDVLPVNGGYMCLTHRVDFDVDNVPESCARTNWHIPRDRLTGAPK